MRYLFEPVPLSEKPLIWDHRSVSTGPFSGFYHWHQCCEILVVHEGNGTIIVNQKTYEIRRNMLFFFQPFQLHKVYANISPEQPYIRSKIHFDPYAFEEKLRPFRSLHSTFVEFWQGDHALPAVNLSDTFDYLEHVFAVHDKNTQKSSSTGETGFEYSLMLILQILNALSFLLQRNQPEGTRALNLRQMGYAEQMMQWIESHYHEDVRLDDIAEAMHLSKFYLSRLFQNETGSSISQYLTARRIKIACRLLQTTSLSIEQIGHNVGISNPSYFIRLFKKEIGTTPLKYRKSLK